MNYTDFLRIAEYGNEAWKGSFTSQEVERNARLYWDVFKWSKENKRPSFIITELINLLKEDDSEKCLEWANRIESEINGCA